MRPSKGPVLLLGRAQRVVVARMLDSSLRLVYPIGREIEQVNALIRRGLLAPALGWPGAYTMADRERDEHRMRFALMHVPRGSRQ